MIIAGETFPEHQAEVVGRGAQTELSTTAGGGQVLIRVADVARPFALTLRRLSATPLAPATVAGWEGTIQAIADAADLPASVGILAAAVRNQPAIVSGAAGYVTEVQLSVVAA